MALSQSALSELLGGFSRREGVGLIRAAVRVALQELIEIDAADVIGAGRYERTDFRSDDTRVASTAAKPGQTVPGASILGL